ncbi:MAG: amidohydrolase, partial [Pseudomonadota bacterium]|nr:amidohydrolase [Pseudomonadota bacterium]
MMFKITLTNGLILAKSDESQDRVLKDIFITDGRIEAIIGAGERKPEGTIVEAAGNLVTPGLINSHHHSHEHYHKGRYDRVPLELWMNYVRPLTPIPLTARHVYL